ncbi:class III lanthionine synthetase LanKC [Microbacterium sp. NPDC090007]|uniref:class III lanthionine synthetase LanKC n=1 Tax=Microbacterium sp. NPDC090007 TaxID=3364204 RepID=UPI003826BA7C
MDPIYPLYARAHPLFYDVPARDARSAGLRFTLPADLDWSPWSESDDGHWAGWMPPRTTLPEQGWKIHVSATQDNAETVLKRVASYCNQHALTFKHLVSAATLQLANSKDADRAASGKFLTIYPENESRLHSTLLALDEQLAGEPGPYVLSDLRWRNGPLYVRYGSFIARTIRVDGVEELAIRNSTGELVPDVRSPAFVIPDWVVPPGFISEQAAALSAEPVPDAFPDVTAAIHHSNAGGIYEAVEPDGTRVVVKEARPYAGLTPDGADAATRLRREIQVLEKLEHLDCVVTARRSFSAHGHEFLVMDRIPGRSLHEIAFERYPLITADPTPTALESYRDWVVSVVARVTDALERVHTAGYTHGDFHPRNIMVLDDETVVLLDFEMARPVEDEAPALLGAPGFLPPDGRTGVALDRWALACLRVFLFAPLTSLINLDGAKAASLARWADEVFELGPSWVDEVTRELSYETPAVETRRDRRPVPTSPAVPDVDEIGAGVCADVSLERLDRAWPGDPAQFAESPASLAHGAGGVLLALRMADITAPDGATEWFHAAAESLLYSDHPALGLMDGVAGVAWARHVLGDAAGASRALERLYAADLSGLGPGLYQGSPGLGLTLLEMGDTPVAIRACLRVAEDLQEQLFTTEVRRNTAATGQAGFMNGWSGASLFALRLYARTQAPEHLKLAVDAVERDIAVCRFANDGSLQVDEGWRLMPYLGSGSAGVGVVLAELLTLRHDARHATLLRGIVRAASPAFVAYSGLLEGRAGLVHFLLAARAAHTSDVDALLDNHAGLFGLHAVERPEGISFPGKGLLRLSADLATGSAGVLSALVALRSCTQAEPKTHPVFLPFLSSPRSVVSVIEPTTDNEGR